jgi:hypothetical protein
MSTISSSRMDISGASSASSIAGVQVGQRDMLLLIALLGLTFGSIYFLPIPLTRLIFLGLLVLAYWTDKYDYVWLIWFFIINDAPGRLFSGTGLHDRRIPIYPLAAGMSFSFQELFLFMYIAKVLIKKKRESYLFLKTFRFYFVAMGIVMAYSVLIGITPSSLVAGVRSLLIWAWVIIIPFYVHKPQQLARVSHMLFPIVFIALALQIHTFITGNYLDYMLRGRAMEFSLAVEDSDKASRAYVSVYLVLVALCLALFYMASKKKYFKFPNYLAGVVFCAVTTIVLSATRGWSIAFGFIIMGSLFQISKGGKIMRLFNLAIASVIIVYILQLYFPLVRTQFEAALERFSTLELLLSGDVTAGGTLQRIDVRGKQVMDHFYRSPIIGWGFSKHYFDHADGHVGLQNMLLNVGIIGFIYLILLFAFLVFKTWTLSKAKEVKAVWGGAPVIFAFGLMAIFIIHGSSSQFWGFIIHFDTTDKILTISFLLAAINAVSVGVQEEREKEDKAAVSNGATDHNNLYYRGK